MPDTKNASMENLAKAVTHEAAKKDRLTRLLAGLQVIRKVLDYGADSSQMRHNQLVWVKDAVDCLLDSDHRWEIIEPRRLRDPLPPVNPKYQETIG